MKRSFLSRAIVAVVTIAPAFAATYTLVDNIIGRDSIMLLNRRTSTTRLMVECTSYFFLFFFLLRLLCRSNYVDRATSQSLNLTYASSDTFVLRTDFNSVLNPNGPGRNSVGIRSRKTYRTHVAV